MAAGTLLAGTGRGLTRPSSHKERALARAVPTTLYLRSDGRANSLNGNGRLELAAPGEEYSDVYVYDPAAPVLSIGGHSCCFPQIAPMGPADQRPAEMRNDVLVYSGEPLPADLEMTGPVQLVLWAASTAVDTDFTAKLVDVHPDGTAINLCDGIIRARFRHSSIEPSPLEPDRPYEYRIAIGSTSTLFRAGHRIRLEVASSNFPQFDRNMNTGHDVGADGIGARIVATQTVFHDAVRPSRLILPVVPR